MLLKGGRLVPTEGTWLAESRTDTRIMFIVKANCFTFLPFFLLFPSSSSSLFIVFIGSYVAQTSPEFIKDDLEFLTLWPPLPEYWD